MIDFLFVGYISVCALTVGDRGKVFNCDPGIYMEKVPKAVETKSATGWGNYRITLDLGTVTACGES